MADISIIIVTWNNEKEIQPCIDSIINGNGNHDKEIEIIVIDNNSSDNTPVLLKQINNDNLKVYNNISNVGFTKAVNQGIEYSKGKYIFFLNPDTILDRNCLEILYNFLNDNNDYAAVCPKLLNEDGSTQFSIRKFPNYLSFFFEFILISYLFPKSKLFNSWKMMYFDYTKDDDVLQPMAAALLIRKEILDKVGNMDERFEMFFNDVDLCKKISDMKKKIRYLKDAAAVHKKGASIYKDRIKMIKIWNEDCVSYFRKYHNNIFLIRWLIISLKFTSFFRIILYKLK